MNMTPIKKIVLALAAVTIVVSMVTANNVASMMMIMAAKKNTQVIVNTGAAAAPNGGSVATTPGASTTPGTSTTPGASTTPDAGTATTPDAGTATTPNAGTATTPEADVKPGSKPQSKEQIISYYAKSLATAKSSAKTVTLVRTGSSNYKGVAEAGKLSDILQQLMGKFMKEEKPNKAVDKGALPPAGKPCNVDPAKVQTATCEENGNNYIITIVTAPENNPVAGNGGAGSIVDVITTKQITDPVAGVPGLSISNINLAYENVKVVATIDKATGKMSALNTTGPCVLSLDAKILVKEMKDAKVGIEVYNDYTIAY